MIQSSSGFHSAFPERLRGRSCARRPETGVMGLGSGKPRATPMGTDEFPLCVELFLGPVRRVPDPPDRLAGGVLVKQVVAVRRHATAPIPLIDDRHLAPDGDLGQILG